MKMKIEDRNLLFHYKVKPWGGFPRFHVGKVGPYTAEVRNHYQVHALFGWMYLYFLYQLKWLVYDIRRLCVQSLHFFWCFFNILWIFEFGSNRRVDQHLNKFKTWKWKTKPGSFLFTTKWSFGEVSQDFMLENLDFIWQKWEITTMYMNCLVECTCTFFINWNG